MSWLSNARSTVAGWLGAKFTNPGGRVGAQVRLGNPYGPWSAFLGEFIPNQVNPYLYEAMRRAVPPLDGGIDRLIDLDGILEVEGDNDALVAEVDDFVRNVPVNDAQQGLQSFYTGAGNELYEQGYALGEFVVQGRDVVGLRVADSKGVRFNRSARGLEVWYCPPGTEPGGRRDGTDDAERIIRGTVQFSGMNTTVLQGFGYTQLDPATLVYAVRAPEADNPYGTSIMRSIEFVSQILLAIQNATDQVWKRFGDPVFNLKYKTNTKLDQEQLKARRIDLAKALADALEGKRKGNAVDFVNALAKDDDITIEIIGAAAHALEIEMPARHMCEQIAAKLNLPGWMLGYSWNSGNVGEPQAEMVLQGSKTRWVQREPGLRRVIETMLRLRGRTWKSGDWKLCQRLPNLRDELKAAQAEFLRAQTVLMLSGAGQLPDSAAEPGSDPRGGGQPKAFPGTARAKALRDIIAAATSPADLAVRLAAFDATPPPA